MPKKLKMFGCLTTREDHYNYSSHLVARFALIILWMMTTSANLQKIKIKIKTRCVSHCGLAIYPKKKYLKAKRRIMKYFQHEKKNIIFKKSSIKPKFFKIF
jgi:hypothetical protein